MPSAKEQITHIVQEQPEDSSYDEILRELALARMIERGLENSRQIAPRIWSTISSRPHVHSGMAR